MKPSLFIALLLIQFSSFAQQDSIAKVRKPVLRFLIGEHYRAVSLDSAMNECNLQKHELQFQIEQYKKLVISHKQDSIQADSLFRLQETVSNSWKDSYEVEKIDHKSTKKQVIKWKVVAMATALLAILLLLQG